MVDRIGHGGQRGVDDDLTDGLCAKRAGALVAALKTYVNMSNISAAGDLVLHQRVFLRHAAVILCHILGQRHADALQNAALGLHAGQVRVYRGTAVDRGHIVHHLGFAGFQVNFHFGGANHKRRGRNLRAVGHGGFQRHRVAALGCCFAGLCYAEFASMIPVAGSAYTYSYATMGELIAWIIGWDLVLEYTVAATTVSISWSRYLVVFLEGLDIHLPQALTACPWDGGVVNIPAFLIVVLMSLFLIRGTEGSSIFNGFIVFLKVSVILIFVILGWKYINTDNYTPYIPANTGVLGEYGFSGILRGAAIVFFAFLGFDAVSTAAQETKNPKRNMPIGILVSLLVCTVLYMVFAHVMTGVAHYTAFSGQQGIAPVAIAIEHMGQADAAGIIQPDYPWLNRAIVLSILFGYCSVIMVTLLGQSRVFLSMSHDGLLPPFFSHINEKFRTPARSNLLFMVLVGLLAAFVPARLAGEMTSIGTLMAFTLVCAAVLVVRRTMPDVPRSFKTPLVPLIPILGILTCLCMMLFLPADTWIRLVLWMLIGLDIYVGYGMKHSKLEHGGDTRHGQVTLNMIGLILAVLCVITGLWHQQTVGWGESKVLLIISFVFAFTHCAYYMWRIWRR